MQFQALGGLTITDGGNDVTVGGPRQRRLVAMLLIHRNAVVSVDRLAEAVFAGEPTAAAATTLRSYVARLRRVVDGNGSDATLLTQAPGYLLRLPGEAFDVARFEALLTDARVRLTQGDAAGSSELLREALSLWRGDAYAEFADEEWARPEAVRLGELRLVAYERLIDAELVAGGATEVIPEIEALVSEHPLRDSFRRQLMLALYRAGRQVDALRAAREYRDELVDELGLDPSPELIELERRILNHDATLVLSDPAGTPLRGYRLGERLGTGRDGTVYGARLPGVERDFAIRVVRQALADDAEFVRSFEATAHRVASLRHPAIVTIHDYWREPGAAYVVMRRMPGGTLRDRLQAGTLTNDEVETLCTRVGGALLAAEGAGIGHGRVIAESILFDDSGLPYLTDFTLGPSDGTCAGEDVHDFAVMIGECLGGGPRTIAATVAGVLARGTSTAQRPSMADFVTLIVTALGDEARTEPAARNPYKGLRAFDEADAADFFGRDAVIEQLLARLDGDDLRSRLVLVVGGSGTGKSSVVRAGLLPRVRRGDVPGSQQWFVTTMLPGSSPFKELAESLRRVAVSSSAGLADELARDGGIDQVIRRLVPDDGQLLLVIDQFEELFTMATEQDQQAFLDGLIHAAAQPDSRLRVVATMRADFYDRPLAFQPFGAAVYDATVTVTAMLPAELESAIVGPAERAGLRVEQALVAELVSAVVDEPAALPSLQFALFELAERSGDWRLTVADYRELGGVSGAIAARAEQLYLELHDTERSAVRRLFERLVVVGSDGETTRRRATRTELSGAIADPIVDALIDRWSQARLLTLDRHPQTRLPTVEVAHEALLADWPRLHRWIDEDRDAIVIRGHLREAAVNWDALGRDVGSLYRGTRLAAALEVTVEDPEGLPEVQREFLDASRNEQDREQRQAADQLKRQARANRRLRIQLVALAATLVIALVGGFVAVDQRRDAQHGRRDATARELAAAADANLDDDPERSMLLALAAIDHTRSADGTVLPEAEAALHRAVTASRVVLSVPGLGGGLDWSPNGDIFVTEGPEESGLIDIRSAATGESLRSWNGHDGDVNDVAFSNDGSMLATGGDDGMLRVWDPATGDELFEFGDALDGAIVYGPSFSPDGSRVAASFLVDSTVRIFALDSEETVATIDTNITLRTAFSPDGRRLAMADAESDVVVVADAATGEQLLGLEGHDGAVRNVAWSPDGQWIATAGGDGTARIWNATTGEQRHTVAGHTALIGGVDWSPDSGLLATASEDGTVRVTEIVEGEPRGAISLSGQRTAGAMGRVAFSPDGSRLMTGDVAMTEVRVWDVSATGGGEWPNIAGIPWSGLDFTPDGALVFGQILGVAAVIDATAGDRLNTIGRRSSSAGDVNLLEANVDGDLIAATNWGGPVDVWSAATGEHVFSVGNEGDDGISGISWSGDGDVLAVGFADTARGKVAIVDRAGTRLGTIVAQPGFTFRSVSLSPDGDLAVVTSERAARDDPSTVTAQIWDWRRGEIVTTIETPSVPVAFDPAGARIATARWFEGVVEVWDAQSGERLATLAAPTPAWNVAFSRDGAAIATAHVDGTVRLWDAETGAERLVLPGHKGPAAEVEFSPDGSMLASSGGDGIVRVWALDLDDLIAIGEERLTRGFTDDECRQFLHVERCPQTA